MDKKRISCNNVQTNGYYSKSHEGDDKSVALSREFIGALTLILFDEP